jgi:hypothetical protein
MVSNLIPKTFSDAVSNESLSTFLNEGKRNERKGKRESRCKSYANEALCVCTVDTNLRYLKPHESNPNHTISDADKSSV